MMMKKTVNIEEKDSDGDDVDEEKGKCVNNEGDVDDWWCKLQAGLIFRWIVIFWQWEFQPMFPILMIYVLKMIHMLSSLLTPVDE